MSIYVFAFVISVVYMIAKIIENKFITKQEKFIKNVLMDGMFVFSSTIIGNYILNQINVLSEKSSGVTTPEVFVGNSPF